jgi:ABC-type sulfate transport system permease subunit
VAFLDIPLIVWGVVNAIIFIILFALPIWFLNFLNKKLNLDSKIEKIHKKIMSFLK